MLGSDNVIAIIPTQDYEQAIEFYVNVLGLEFVEDREYAVVLKANGVTVRLALAPEYEPSQFPLVGWKVKDIENKVKELTERGVEFERLDVEGQDDGGVLLVPDGTKVAMFRDPDGNLLVLSEGD